MAPAAVNSRISLAELKHVDQYMEGQYSGSYEDGGRQLAKLPTNTQLILLGVALAAEDKALYESILFLLEGTEH